MKRGLAWILIVMLLLAGCSGKASAPDSEEKATLTLTPVDLFKGDGAKFQPFLGNMSGAIKLRYKGEKPNAWLVLDIWQNGKKVSSSGSIGDLFFSSDGKKITEIEVIFSIEVQEENARVKISNQSESGSSTGTFLVPWDKKLTAQGLIFDDQARTFKADGEVHVWGMQATSTNSMRTADFSPESLSRLEYAIILTLRFED